MRSTFILWKLEWKQMWKKLPGMLLEAIILVAILAAVAFGAGKLLYQDTPMIRISIGVVEEEENPLTDLLLNYVQGMESISETCEFLFVTKEEGFRLLQEQKLAALLILPDSVAEGILTGQNVPVQVYFPEDAGMESALLKELTDAGVSMLQVAQAEIYGIYDTAKEFGALEHLSVLETDINKQNLAFALNRMALFRTQKVSATGSLTWTQYYMASGLIYFLLLLGMACYPMMQPYTKVMSNQLSRQGIGVGKQCIGKWLCGFTSLAIGLLAVVLVTGIFHRNTLGSLLLILLCVTALVFLIFQIVHSGVTAVLLLFFLSTVMVYCSGGFLPSIFLPESVQIIGKFLPTTYLIQAAASLFTGTLEHSVTGALLGYTAGFCAVSYGICLIRKEEKA